MRLQCFNVQMDFWLCLASFQVSGQNTETLLDAPLNTERPFCCPDSGLSACSLFRGFGYRLGRRILMRIRLAAKVISGTRRTRRPSAERNAQLGWFDSSILDTENKSQLQSGFKFGVPTLARESICSLIYSRQETRSAGRGQFYTQNWIARKGAGGGWDTAEMPAHESPVNEAHAHSKRKPVRPQPLMGRSSRKIHQSRKCKTNREAINQWAAVRIRTRAGGRKSAPERVAVVLLDSTLKMSRKTRVWCSRA